MLSAGIAALFLVACVNSIAVSHRQRFPGPYCQTRQPQQCCPGRDDTCTVPIRDTVCYCDQFCGIHSVEDCCPDFQDVCQRGPTTRPPTPKPPGNNECIHDGRYYQVGQTVTQNCNTCKCVLIAGLPWLQSIQTWECENLGCINEPLLVERVNRGNYGWTAVEYSKFNGESLVDGLRYYLGTIQPKAQVVRLHPVKVDLDEILPREFDTRVHWPGQYIHPAMDQGRCAASWAFSTAGVAADRWSIQSDGRFLDAMSVQSMISCARNVEGCDDGGRVEDAWYYLQTEGVVSYTCYPYTSGTTRLKGQCTYVDELTCADDHVHKTTPPYRIDVDERKIMKEIQLNGPVQAIITVHPDFYLYERGIYSHSGEGSRILDHDHTISGTHSVKIIGWGEENGVKFWRCVNSWGDRWGEDGMFRIKRGSNEIGIEGFVVGVWPRVEKHDIQDRRHRRHRHRQ